MPKLSQLLRYLLLYFLSTHEVAAISGPPIVDLGYVKYSGYNNATSSINYFCGIPYAQPPIGNLRWQKPLPIEALDVFNEQTIDASEVGPGCYSAVPAELISVSGPFLGKNQSEDCLILDVLVPDSPVSSRLPVLVQIHSGGYTSGSAQVAPGDAIVHASKGKIIYVSIQYRLGMLGFLAGSEIMLNGVANAGLLDQRAALEWIQRNIAHFGGDPSMVTIWGISAGGGSVSYQLVAGGAFDNPPFSAAIAEYPWWQPLANATTQDLQYRTALDLSNCTNLACLRSLDSDILRQVNLLSMNVSYPGPGYGYGLYNYGPVVDGIFIRQLPNMEFQQNRFHKVPLLVDANAYEGVLFSNSSQETQAEETADAELIFPYAGATFFSRLYQLYPASDFNSTFFQRQTWFGDFIVKCPTAYMSTAMVDRARNASAVFKLLFDAGSQIHGATIPFLSSADIGFPSANNLTIAEIMAKYWISFAVTHDPNPLRDDAAPVWPSYYDPGAALGEGSFDVLSVTYSSVETVQDSDIGPQCDFFSSQDFVISN